MSRHHHDDHLLVTLMYDQLDALEQQIAAARNGGTVIFPGLSLVSLDAWIQDTRRLLPERGKRG